MRNDSVKPSALWSFSFLFFKKKLQLTHNVTLVSGVRRGSATPYVMLAPHKCSHHLSHTTLSNTIGYPPGTGPFNPCLTHSVPGSLHLPLPCTRFAHPPTLQPQFVLRFYESVSVCLFLCFDFFSPQIIWYLSFSV